MNTDEQALYVYNKHWLVYQLWLKKLKIVLCPVTEVPLNLAKR